VRFRFLHFADCHLGYRQYGHLERINDFTKAFYRVIDKAIAERVDFVVLAGDLFQTRSINALTLYHAIRGLERLKSANIPCIAVEGNHELSYYQDRISWMQFLAQRELLILLDAKFDAGKAQLLPYADGRGAYIEPLPKVRVFGMKFRGSSTAKALQTYAEALSQLQEQTPVDYTIFIAHTGIEGVLSSHAGGLSHRQLATLHQHVDYLALGHIHKPFQFDDWIYNPGSTESCSLQEASWPKRGYYLVSVDTDHPKAPDEPKHVATLGSVQRRPIVRINISVDLHETPQALYDHALGVIQRKANDFKTRQDAEESAPIVELQLSGVLPFDRTALHLDDFKQSVEQAFSPLVCLVKNATIPADFHVEADTKLNRRELEKQILSDLLRRDARYRGQSDGWAELIVNLKHLALTGASPEAVLEELRSQAQRLTTEEPVAPETGEPEPDRTIGDA
jgi:DNA repair exonuclease SbcCD nuclease subunit